ncbi:hypothetical protein IJ707_04255 [bacterium]|nr:hypothetical protein [bacterium]
MNESNPENQINDNEEIEFDDNIDIDALQAKLQMHMTDEGVNYTPAPEVLDGSNAIVPSEESIGDTIGLENFVQSVETNRQEQNNTPKEDEKLKLKLGEKKYIVYIEPDNIDFIDGLTIRERKKVINRLLKEEDTTLKKRKLMQERAKFINQIIIMVVTVVVSLPIFFILLNKSIEITILNYQQSQQNFVKLYKEQGKIKSYKKFKKTFD